MLYYGMYTVCMYISIIICTYIYTHNMYVHIHTLVHTCMYTPISSKFTYTHPLVLYMYIHVQVYTVYTQLHCIIIAF